MWLFSLHLGFAGAEGDERGGQGGLGVSAQLLALPRQLPRDFLQPYLAQVQRVHLHEELWSAY